MAADHFHCSLRLTNTLIHFCCSINLLLELHLMIRVNTHYFETDLELSSYLLNEINSDI